MNMLISLENEGECQKSIKCNFLEKHFSKKWIDPVNQNFRKKAALAIWGERSHVHVLAHA